MKTLPMGITYASKRTGCFALRIILLVLGPIALFTSCKAVCDDGCKGSNLGFSEKEIRSKTWKSANGQVVGCLRWEIENLKCPGPLLVVQYGDTREKVPTCLEFYRVIYSPPTSVAAYDLSTQVFKEKRLLPSRTNFIFLAKDYGESVVKKAEVIEGDDSASIAITRETPSSQKTARRTAFYFVKYNKNFCILRDVHTWISDIPDAQ